MNRLNYVRTATSGFNRVVALALAVATLLIPVELPFAASAATITSDKYDQIYVTEDFTDADYVSGVKYYWDEQLTEDGDASVARGTYNITIGKNQNKRNYIVLNAETSEWTDYTVSMDSYKDYLKTPEEIPDYHPGIMLCARMSYDEEHGGYSCYMVKGHVSSGMFLIKRWYNPATGKFVDSSLGKANLVDQPDKAWRNMSITVDGNLIFAEISDPSGKTDRYTWEDDGVTYGPVLEKGGVGLYFECESKNETWKAMIDNFKVVMKDGSVAFNDEFVDNRYERGVEYQWSNPEAQAQAGTLQWVEELKSSTVAGIRDGSYFVDPGGNDKLWLKAESENLLTGEKTSIANDWKDYTVEFDWWGDYSEYATATTIPGVSVMARMEFDEEHGDYSYYNIKFHPGLGCYVLKYYYDTTLGKWMTTDKNVTGKAFLKPFNGNFVKYFENGGKVHAKVTIKSQATGVSIEATLTDMQGNVLNYSMADASGTGGNVGCTGSIVDDGSATGEAPTYAGGNVGLLFEGGKHTLSVDNIKLTLDGEAEPVIYEQFSNRTYFDGVGTVYNPSGVELWPLKYSSDIKFTWDNLLAVRNGHVGEIQNGVFHWSTNGNDKALVTLDSSAKDPLNTGVVFDPASEWSDYTIDMDIKANHPTTGTFPGIFAVGRVQYDRLGNVIGYYAVKVHESNGVAILKCYIDKNTGKWIYDGIGAGYSGAIAGGTGVNGNDRHLQVKFANTASGVMITARLTDMKGNSVLRTDSFSVVDDGNKIGNWQKGKLGAPYMSGTMGFEVEDLSFSWDAYIDNYSVTLPGASAPVFKDEFTLKPGQSTESYLAQGQTAKDGLVEMEYIFPNIWKVENGVMSAECMAPRLNLFKIGSYYAGGEKHTDFGAEMMNYTVDVDVMLKTGSSYASAIANYSDNSYYEARVTSTGVTLYRISGEEEIILQQTEKKINTNTWYSLKLEVSRNGKTVRVFCDYELMAEIKSVPNACKMGYMGLKVNGNAAFDNFSVRDTNISDGRPFDTYKFYLASLAELAPNWNVSGVTSWAVKNNRLVNVGSATTASNLLLKDVTAYTDYCVTSIGVMAENGQMGVIGRYSDGNFYKLVLDSKDKDLVLTRVKDGISTQLDRVPGELLYQEGITIDGGEEYELKLYMYGESLMAYINGELVISVRDEALTSGVAGVLGTNGVALESVVVSEAMQPPVFTFVDADGKILTETKWVPKEEVDPSLWMNGVDLYEVEFDVGTADSPMHVPLGKYPDLTLMYLNVYDGVDTTIRVPVDTLEFDGLVCDELGLHQLEVYYEGYTAILYYETIDRTEEIKQLIRDIQGFSLMELPIEHVGDVYDLLERYEDLSYIEKQQVPDDVKRKLELAKECVLVMLYGAESLGELIFSDNFDTAESEDNYTADSDYNIIGETDPGNWFVMNGNMYQYDTNEVIHEGPGFSSAKMVKDKYYEVTSVSVDVMLMHPTAWAGLRFNSLGGNYYKYQLTTKNNDRMVLNKTSLALYTRTYVDMPVSQGGMGLDLKAYEWYTIRIVFDKDEGIIHCYINDRKVFSYKDENMTPVRPEVLTYGMAGFCMGEGWVRFDNFEIRGKEVENPGNITNYYNTDLEPKEFQDNFNDEGANVGSDPSHWVEPSTANVWKAKKEGNNVFYGNTNNLNNSTATWLHVFERDTELTAKVRVNEVGKFANFGLLSRLIGSYSYIHAGYDFYLQKWYIEYQYGADFEKEYFYADETSPFTVGKWYEVKVRSVGTDIELYLDGKLMIKGDSGKMINPGRVGFAAINCNIDVDDVDLQQLSGQGRVEDGVMEQYTAHAGAPTGTLFQVFELQDGRFLMHEGSNLYFSSNEGNTWERASTKFKSGSFLRLHDGTILTIFGSEEAWIWDEATDTSTKIGTIPEGPSQNHSQPSEHLSEYQMEDGTWRIFFTVADQNVGNVDNVGERKGIVDIFYSDDGGYTWKQSKTDIYTITNHTHYCESHVVQLKKDVVDLTGRILPAGTLLDYTTYNSDDSMRYHVSFDGGVTWEGDYAIPYITVCGMNTCTIEWDEETQAYYLATQYNIRGTLRSGHARHRVALMRSYDGYNWEYLADVDRWGDLSDTDRGHIMHCVNMYLDVTDDYVFVSFSRSERFAETTHRIQEGHTFRFDKDKLTAYEEWPAEYAVKDNAIVAIEGISDDVMTQSNYSTEGIFKVYYYDGTTELVNLRDAIVSNDSLRLIREKDITIDYKFFRTVLRINVVDTKPTLITNPDEAFEVTLKGGGLAHFEVSRDQLGQFFSVFGDTAYVVLGDELIDAVDGKASGPITLSEAVMEQEAIDEVQGDTVLLVIGNRSEETKTFTVKFEKNENAGDHIPPSSSSSNKPSSKPNSGDDKPEVPELQPDMTLWIIVGLAGAVLVVGAVVTILVVKSKKKSKKENQTPEENIEPQEEQ